MEYFDSISKEYAESIYVIEKDINVNVAMLETMENSYIDYFEADIDVKDRLYSEILYNSERGLNLRCNLYYVDMQDKVISGGSSVQDEVADAKQLIKDGDLKQYASVKVNGINCVRVYKEVRDSEGNVKGYVVAYATSGNFAEAITDAGKRDGVIYCLINTNSDIIYMFENNDRYMTSEKSLTEELDKTSLSDVDKRYILSRIRASHEGKNELMVNDYSQHLFYVKGYIPGFAMVAFVDGNYIDTLIAQNTRTNNTMLNTMLVGGGVFVILMIIFVILDKTRTDKAKRYLLSQAETDQLTKLYNKVATEDYIKAYLEGEGKDHLAAMFVIDLDNFKRINDTMGHAFGDEVLRSLGKGLRMEFRVDDIVGRIGGDEFIVFLRNMKTEEIIKKEGARIERFFRSFRVGEYVKYATTASIGAAIYPQDGKNFRELYMLADQALYDAKKKGKNRLSFYEKRHLTSISEDNNENKTAQKESVNVG